MASIAALIRNTDLREFASTKFRDRDWHWHKYADWLMTYQHRGIGAGMGDLIPELAEPSPVLPVRKPFQPRYKPFRCGHYRTAGNTGVYNGRPFCVLCELQYAVQRGQISAETAAAIRERLRI